MARGTDRLVRKVKRFVDTKYKILDRKYGQQVIDLLDFPITFLLAPFTLAYDFVGSAQRGFGFPELASKLSFTAIFAVAYLGTYDIALELGKKVICQRNCGTCNGWNALRCTTCKGSGHVQYQVKNPSLKRVAMNLICLQSIILAFSCYVWAAAGKQPDLEKHVGVGGYGYPVLVAMYLKKGAYAPPRSAFELDPIM